MPKADSEWPPKHMAPAYRAYRIWDAWYGGNPDQLRDVYANTGNGTSIRPSERVRAGQYAGGVVGTIWRFLWGAPPPTSQRDGRLHIPMPADLAAVSANLLFSEPPKLTAPKPKTKTADGKPQLGDQKAQAFLDRLAEDGFHTKLLQAAEACSMLGDVYLRPVIDKDVFPDRAVMSIVHADGAIPVIRWGKLVEVTLWQTLLVDNHDHVRLLEHHDVVNGQGRITYAVFKGTTDKLGSRVKLTDFTESAYLADVVDENGIQETGLDRLDVVRVPNAGPQRLWRTAPGLKYLGRSDFDGNEQLFDRLDEIWTSWMRDIWAAKARIMAPEYMLKKNGPGQGATFDPEQEIFTAMTMLPNQSGNNAGGITMTDFKIRWQEHKSSADAMVEQILRHAGFSSQTLGDEGEVPVTATEIQSRERQSFTTRAVRIQTWTPAIAEYIWLHMALEQVVFKGPEPIRPDVEFGDSVTEAPETLARTLQLLDAAGAISTETKVRRANPDWGQDEVDAEVARIKKDHEEKMAVENPDPEPGSGLPGKDQPFGEE